MNALPLPPGVKAPKSKIVFKKVLDGRESVYAVDVRPLLTQRFNQASAGELVTVDVVPVFLEPPQSWAIDPMTVARVEEVRD